MTCQDVERLTDAYIDGELDAANALALELHLQECAACAARIRDREAVSRAVKSATYFTAPAGLAGRISRVKSASESSAPPSRRLAPWLLVAASLVIASASVAFGLRQQSVAATDRTARAVTDRHVASLMADHLTDVTSTDRHTVKPWFAGRLEFSPPVADLAADGFPLVGGRLDYVDGHAAMALVYKRAAHVINVFAWPNPDAAAAPSASTDSRGYHLVQWADGGFTWWAVSDVASGDLLELARKLTSH